MVDYLIRGAGENPSPPFAFLIEDGCVCAVAERFAEILIALKIAYPCEDCRNLHLCPGKTFTDVYLLAATLLN